MSEKEGMVVPLLSFRNFQSAPLYSARTLIAVADRALESVSTMREADVALQNMAHDVERVKAAVLSTILDIENTPMLRDASKAKICEILNQSYQALLSAVTKLDRYASK